MNRLNDFKIGIKDFEHIKIIAAHIRMILNLIEVKSTRCISKVLESSTTRLSTRQN